MNMEPGETIVAVTSFRGDLLVFGSYGTVLKGYVEENTGEITFSMHHWNIPMQK